MDVTVDATGSDDHIFSGDHFGGCSYHQVRINSLHGVGISGFADLNDSPVLDADITFDDSPMIEDHRVGDDQIQRASSRFADRGAALAHAVANHFAPAAGYVIAVARIFFLDFDDQVGTREPNSITCGRAIQVCVHSARNREAHRWPPPSPAKNPAPLTRRKDSARISALSSTPSTKPLNP